MTCTWVWLESGARSGAMVDAVLPFLGFTGYHGGGDRCPKGIRTAHRVQAIIARRRGWLSALPVERLIWGRFMYCN